MAETGTVKVTIDDEKIKERMREFLAKAWDEGYGVGANKMFPHNPYRSDAD